MKLTGSQAIELSRTEGVSIGKLEEMGFTLIGEANVVAKAAAPPIAIVQNEALTAAAELLYEEGRNAPATRAGRTKRVLGDKDGLGPYRVIVTRKA